MSFVFISSELVIHNPNSCLLNSLCPGYPYTECLLSVCPCAFISNPPPTLSTLVSFFPLSSCLLLPQVLSTGVLSAQASLPPDLYLTASFTSFRFTVQRGISELAPGPCHSLSHYLCIYFFTGLTGTYSINLFT